MTTLVEQLSTYCADLRYEDLPGEVVGQAKRLIIDTVGCALGGYWSEPARIARDIAATVRSSEPVTVIGSGERTSPDLATFANGVMIRFLDFNDGYTSTGESGHPSDSIAAVLSAAELRRRSGREAITATVLAYEVFCRICDEADLKPLGFDHVTVGGMASTAAAARLLGLAPPEIAQAFNLAIAPNVALYQTRIGHVSMWKGCAYANASRNAVFAAMLAARGMTGPAPIFEGVGGYFKAVTRKPFELRTLGRAGHSYKIMECSIKRFPLGQYSQTVIEAALQLRNKMSSPDAIAEIRIETVTTAIRLMAGDIDKWEPKTRESADHSMPYTVAIAFLFGEVEQRHFGEHYLRDPKVLALTQRVKAKGTEEADRRMPDAMFCKMDVVTVAGETHTAVVEYHKGHWKNPMSDAEVEGKFCRLAREALEEERAERLLATLRRLESLDDAGDIVRLTKAG
ncbi:MAG TPA: MmgE/PrpD family protein [Burkholderiales bacterium]|nr:MmgE/PrpD family protein [Burkholderiales bacterium]